MYIYTDVSSNSNPAELCRQLEVHGLAPEGLPVRLGGLWDYHRAGSAAAAVAAALPGPGDAKQAPQQQISSKGGDDVVVSPDHRHMLIQAMLQVEDKAAYVQACQTASSQLQQDEAPLDRFLRVERLHFVKAAQRLTRYWALRSAVFGKTLAYKPIDQTGEGALERKDLTNLGTGFLSLLPNDSSGAPVLWLDSWRIRAGASEQSLEKCLFYMFSLLAENEASQTSGATLLYFMSQPPFKGIDLEFLERLADSLPIRFKAVHLLSTRPVIPNLQSHIRFGDQVHVHVELTQKEKLADRLESFGLLSRANLPKRLGGAWGYEKFVQWQELADPIGVEDSGRSEWSRRAHL